MKSLTINIHSFVDLITNSSTEIFVQATDQTVKSVKKLIDELLKLGNSQYKCEDLFDISLMADVWDDDIEDFVRKHAEYDSGDYETRYYLTVKAKVPEAKDSAKTLNTLKGFFEAVDVSA
jgi:hypothetical protein